MVNEQLNNSSVNTKVLLTNHYSLLYGLLIIENDTLDKAWKEEAIKKIRQEFLKNGEAYYESIGKKYSKTDISKLISTNITEAFNELLEENEWQYSGTAELNFMIHNAKSVISNYELNNPKKGISKVLSK